MKFIYNDGGRSKYFKGEAKDCVCRAIAIATNRDYKEVYILISNYMKEATGKKSARNGIPKKITKKIMKDLGFKWIPTMTIGSGCQTHLNENELPKGTIIASVSHHLTCIKDGVINDTYDCSRSGNRCVYGYYIKE